MVKVTLTEEQLKALFGCLDLQLKANGLMALQVVLDLYNALSAAQKVEEPKPPQQG